MNPPNSLIDRVNSLMHRKRVFVAGAGHAPENPTPAPLEDEDLPVLTEIVDISEVSSDTPGTTVQPPLDPLIAAVTQEFAQQLQQRFSAELPGMIDEATTRLATELQQAVFQIAQQALREFVSQRRQPAPAASDVASAAPE